jgi:hypothetical protein
VPLRIFSVMLIQQQSLVCRGFPVLYHFVNRSIWV